MRPFTAAFVEVWHNRLLWRYLRAHKYTHTRSHTHTSWHSEGEFNGLSVIEDVTVVLVSKYYFCTCLGSLSQKPFPHCFRVLPNTLKYIFTQGVFVLAFFSFISAWLVQYYLYFCLKYFHLFSHLHPPITQLFIQHFPLSSVIDTLWWHVDLQSLFFCLCVCVCVVICNN